ncbi:MAG: aliphatic sulfonate ABC transporter substrate-binding protein [Chlorobiaceae bacterium]|nr:aliphatic sulfonate ABC transporter substrate-binding protein [Chlorobiaceae bacterium]
MRGFIIRRIICICMLLRMIFNADAYAASVPAELRVDYADFNPLSLVVKKFNWLDKEFKADTVRIHWKFSPGSDVALKNLQADSLDIASSASLSSVWSRAVGGPIKVVYVFARPEWNALVVSRDSPLQSVKDLKGRKVAVALGTGPYFFLMLALKDAGMHKEDVKIIPMPHEDGRASMEQNFVDAWAGGSPYVAMSQLESGSRLIYRNALFHSYGFLNVTEAFARKYPDAVLRVVKVYENARNWAIRHPEDLEMMYGEEARVPLSVARKVLSSYDFSRPVFDRNDVRLLRSGLPVLKEEHLFPQDTDFDKVIDDLIDTRFVFKHSETGSLR